MNFFNLGSGYKTLLIINKEDGMNILKISKKVDVTYTHTFHCVSELKKRRLVNVKKKGRQNKVKISNRGHKIAMYLKLIMDEMGEVEKNG